MDKANKAILAKGLLEGYVGKSVRGSVVRAGFDLETSDYNGPKGKYHDEWAADFNGGGQELTEASNGEKATRVYAGGTLAVNELQKLGLTKLVGDQVFDMVAKSVGSYIGLGVIEQSGKQVRKLIICGVPLKDFLAEEMEKRYQILATLPAENFLTFLKA